MKLDTGFIAPHRDHARVLAAALGAVALVLVVTGVWTIVSTVELYGRRADLAERVTALKANAGREEVVAGREALRDLTAVRERVTRMNELIGHHGRPALSLLATLERLLPEPATLTSLQHRIETGDVVLVVSASATVPLTAFLRALEREPRFHQVLLMRQATAKSGGVQFEIRLKERA